MYHFAGSKGSSAAKSGVTPTKPSFTTSLSADDALPVQSALDHGAEVKNPPLPATNPAYERRETAAVANKTKNLGSPAGEILPKARVAAPQNLPGLPTVGRDRGQSFSVAPEAKNTPATLDAVNTLKNPATPKEEKSATSSAPEISAASNPTMGVAATLASAEKKT